MPAGRPSKYDPAFCDRVIELGKEGMGKCEMAAELDLCYNSFETYQADNPEFLKAVSHALRLSQAWWEKNGRLATFGGFDGFNATSYIFNMKNRFKEDWRDKVEQEHSGGVTVERVERAVVDPLNPNG
jgi:transposase